jgi:hypothetical protein
MSQTKHLVAAVLAALALAAPVAGQALTNVGNAVPVACSGGTGSGGGCTI